MRARAYPLLEQTIEDGVRFYLLNRVNKYTARIDWVKQSGIDRPKEILVAWEDIERHIKEIAEEAADHIMTGICEHFSFTDDEAVVPMEEEASINHPEIPDSSPAPGVEKIIEFLEQEMRAAGKLVDNCVDHADYMGARLYQDREEYLDLILRRIKAEDFSSPLDTDG